MLFSAHEIGLRAVLERYTAKKRHGSQRKQTIQGSRRSVGRADIREEIHE